ncbi:MAG TPA: hypothetical protein VMS17_14145 [Gemmataceae bacterium]|nr:hypothetical protein [Gemmataceae bacterium]
MNNGETRSWTEKAFGWLSPLAGLVGGSYTTLGLLALGLGLIVLILIALSGFSGTAKTDANQAPRTDAFDEARTTLEHNADVGACRAALHQVNAALNTLPADQRPAPNPQATAQLKSELGLSDDEGAEIGADNYTVLDGWHLASAFLFRDAAMHALEPGHIGIALPPQSLPTPLERATAAFAWAVREVRLAPTTTVNKAPPHVVIPPQFVLRRGSGTPLERSLVFLALLDQLNAAGAAPFKLTAVDAGKNTLTVQDDGGKAWTIPVGDARTSVDGATDKKIADLKEGMAVAVEGKDGKATHIDAWTSAPPPALLGCLVLCDGRDAPSDAETYPWACGVMIYGKPDVYLFDPRLGLPIPGADGEGVATLADVAHKPELLGQLKIEGAPPYDVTPAQAAKAELDVVCTLSSLAPRMEHLQNRVLPPVRVSLYHNVDRETQLFRAAGAPVQVWKDGPELLRRFLAPEEGGVDKGWPSPGFPLRSLVGFTEPNDPALVQMPLYRLFQLELAPWDVMPATFHDLNKFPYNVGLGLRVRDGYMAPFVRITLEPQGPRDLLLRGDFDKAAGDLVGYSARMEQQQKRIVDERKALAEQKPPETLEENVDDWAKQAIHAYAVQIESQAPDATPDQRAEGDKLVDNVWRNSASIRVLLEGASSGPGLAEVTYQLGLCKHEKAEQAQARLDLLLRENGGKAPDPETLAVKNAWMDALGWWKKYGDEHPEEVKDRPSTYPGRAAAVRRMRARAQATLGDGNGAAATLSDPKEPPLFPMEKLAAAYLAQQMRHGLH